MIARLADAKWIDRPTGAAYSTSIIFAGPRDDKPPSEERMHATVPSRLLSTTMLLAFAAAGGCAPPSPVNPTPLTDDVRDERGVAFSPDGKFIAFERMNDTGGSDIWVRDPWTGEERLLTDAPKHRNGEPTWSPDGKWIAFQSSRDGGSNVYVVHAGKGESADARAGALTSGESMSGVPSWSADGKTIAFESDRGGCFDVYVVAVTGGGPKVLTRSASHDNQPAFSPDGKLIAFSSTRAGRRDIWIVDADGSFPRRLTKDRAADTRPAWTPDSLWVVFLREAPDGRRSIHQVFRDGRKEKTLLEGSAELRDVTVSPDGRHVAFAANPEGNYDLYMVTFSDTGGRRPR
jgi:TolB protein